MYDPLDGTLFRLLRMKIKEKHLILFVEKVENDFSTMIFIKQDLYKCYDKM